MAILAGKEGKGNPDDIAPPREGLLARIPEGALTIAIVVLASSASFGLGMLAEREIHQEGEGIRIEGAPTESTQEAGAVLGAAIAAPAPKAPTPSPAPAATSGNYVASKSGTKYYLPWCGTVKRIKDENKVWFDSKEEAEAAGYQPAANCKGI